MPITPFLAGQAFDPETSENMSEALVAACEALHLKVGDDPATRFVAEKVIEFTQRGIRDPNMLRKSTLQDGGRMKRREFIALAGGAAVMWPLATRACADGVAVLGTVWIPARRIEECRSSAAQCRNKNDREFWLKMAARWEGFQRQSASARRIHRTILLMGRGESGWKGRVKEINNRPRHLIERLRTCYAQIKNRSDCIS
jgi:hypothetical protein